MDTGRRSILAMIMFALGAARPLFAGQAPQPRFPSDAAPPSATKHNPHDLLKANQKDIRKDVQRLAELAEELKAEVEKTDSAEILSLPLVRKAEEIEKLAKHIKTLARG